MKDFVLLKEVPMFLATGSSPIACPVACGNISMVQAIDILSCKEKPGENNIIIGGGLVGLETALYITSLGYKATVIEMKSEVGKNLNFSVAKLLLEELEEKEVEILTSTKLKKISAKGIECETKEGEICLKEVDKVVVAIGSRAYNPLEEELKNTSYKVITIGDAVHARKAYAAIEEGARAALQI